MEESKFAEKQQQYSGMGLKTYPKQNYQTKPVNQKQINQIKTALKKDVADLRKDLLQALNDKSNFPDSGSGIKELANKALQNDPTLMSELSSVKNIIIPRDVQSKQAGLTYQDKQALNSKVYQAENAIIEAKTGYPPSGENLKTIASYLGLYQNGAYLNGFNDTKMRELILLDDFSDMFKSIAKVALPFVSQLPVVGPIAKTLGGMFGLGQDAGMDVYDKSTIVSKPWTKQYYNSDRYVRKAERESEDFLPGSIQPFKVLSNLGGALYDMNTVNNSWLAGWLYPDTYGGVSMPQKQARKVFAATDNKVYQFSSDSSGQIVLCINPYNIFNPGANATQFFILQQTGWVRATGASIPGIELTGPLGPQQGLFTSFFVSQFKITTRSLLSDLNNSGMTELTYFSDQNLTAEPVIPGNSLSGTSYKVLSNKVEGSVRQWPVFDQTPNNTTTAYNPNNFFFIVVSGLPSSASNCFELVVSYSIDCTTTTTASSASWLSFDYPDIGPGTGDLINSLLSQYPWLLFMSDQHACELASAVKKAKGNTIDIGAIVSEFAERNRSTYEHKPGVKLNADLEPNISFDVMSAAANL